MWALKEESERKIRGERGLCEYLSRGRKKSGKNIPHRGCLKKSKAL